MDQVSTADDAQLYQMTRAGSSEAFSCLVDRHKDSLVNYLTRLTGQRDRAEDLAQEAFLRLYQKGGTYVEQGKFKAYLFRIATNLMNSQYRREKRWSVVRALFDSSSEISGYPSPQVDLLRHELGQRLSAALLELPMRYRAPVVLSRVEGWSHRQIAQTLGCREGTVKSRIHRARRLLQQKLEPYLNGDQE